ncbi:MAG TPA: nucleotide exchange factor GrpE [Isosphaeraceae bacterium]|jgi:molecular chaperone GrpE|nr:nucleotide exchange factor GrpE [Isosphaeraceae bacterium]
MNPDPTTNDTEAQAPADPGAAGTPADELAEARRQRDEYLELLQRSRAEFENYRKRAKAQADADRQYAVAALAKDLLEVVDNAARGAEAARVGGGAQGLVEGFEMVLKQLHDTLAKHGVEPIDAKGQPFDPNLHEALAHRPHPEHPEGTVVDELARGYRLRDRVLRPSRVAVSAGPEK